jgi:hypothetical protein
MVETSAPPTKYGNHIIVQFMAMVKPLERLKMSLGFTVQGWGQIEHLWCVPVGAWTVINHEFLRCLKMA